MGIIPTRWALDRLGERWKNLEEVEGKSYSVEMGGAARTLIVSYHPAACIYNRKLLPGFERTIGAVVKAANRA